MNQVFSHFYAGRFADVITASSDLDTSDVEMQRVVGISHLRLGQYNDAEPWLLRAFAQGDTEGTVEYGNLLRATGRIEEAISIFQKIDPQLDGEFKLRCMRWWGVSEFLAGNWIEGLRKCEQAWLGYLALKDEETACKIAQNIALIHNKLGNYKKSEKFLKECLRLESKNYDLKLNVIKTLADVYIETGRFKDAENMILVGDKIEEFANASILHHYLTTKVSLMEIKGLNEDAYRIVNSVYKYSIDQNDYDLLIWSSVRLSDYLSQSGDFTQALRIIITASAELENIPIELALAKALIHRRQGDLKTSIQELEHIRSTYEHTDPNRNSITALLHLGYAYYIQQDYQQSLAALKEGLEGLLRLNSHTAFKPVLEEMSELLHYASLEPSLEPYLEPVMDSMADLLGGGPVEDAERIRVQVYTFGQVSVARDGTTVQLSLRGSVPLLVYLAQRPNRTRAELQLDLYPDKEPDAAGAYVRQSIRELREVLGRDVIIGEGPHNQPRYRLGDSVQLDLDLQRFMDAVDSGEVARALALYRGEFLPGMDESEWVRGRREETRLALTFELRNQLARYREDREWRRVVLLANQYLRVDPYDLEVHEMRVEAARRAGSATELARYIAQMKSLNN